MRDDATPKTWSSHVTHTPHVQLQHTWVALGTLLVYSLTDADRCWTHFLPSDYKCRTQIVSTGPNHVPHAAAQHGMLFLLKLCAAMPWHAQSMQDTASGVG
jgi:hypothetical protein